MVLDKVKDADEREWYMRAAVEYGWSRDVLVHQIESGLYQRQGKAVTNFDRTLPAPQSDLARQILKDPYTLDVVKECKGLASYALRNEFPDLLKLTSMWTRSYFASTAGTVSQETIQRYIAAQTRL